MTYIQDNEYTERIKDNFLKDGDVVMSAHLLKPLKMQSKRKSTEK